VGKESPHKKERKMTYDSHEGSHNKDTKANGIQGMSQKDFDKELVDIKESVNALMKFLEEHEKDQLYGWELRKKTVRWNLLFCMSK
jgi:hypothetical protein